jgi:hypothetical protein
MPEPARRFVLHSPIRDLDAFRRLAGEATKLKPYGDVAVNVSTLADKSWYEIPAGGSPWHEYASLNPTLFKFFPHPVLARYIPAEFVARNRALLLAKAEILREHGLQAGFWSYDPNILPEALFRDHPHLRGPRVDHPRRSKEEAFALCTDREDVREMYAWMMAELVRHVPELTVYSFKTNDAGSGFCWAENLYSGPNGPGACRSRHVGERARGFLDAIHRGAREAGGEVDIFLSGYITDNELDKILLHLPEHAWLEARTSTAMTLGSLINETFPVVGACNPLGLMAQAERLRDPRIATVFIGLRAMYDRGHETIDTSSHILDLIVDGLNATGAGLWPRLERLRRLCAAWGGEQHTDSLFEAFVGLHEALRLKSAAAGQLGTYSGGVTQRWITRPLVIKPDLLTPEEEAHFLPYIFNIHEQEARHDYIDLAGSRLVPDCLPPTRDDPRLPAIHSVIGRLRETARAFEAASDGPHGAWLGRMALSLRLWTNLLRTANNFYGAQLIRDRCAEALAGPPRIPSKIPTWTGDPALLAFNDIRRDEMDNAVELIDLLERGGLELVVRAVTTREADPFILEPELIEHVRKKIAITRGRWLDGERYLTSPFK